MLVFGPFANQSEDFNHVVGFIAHEKAAAWLEKRKMNPCAARALFRQGLVQRLGLLVMRGMLKYVVRDDRSLISRHLSTGSSGQLGHFAHSYDEDANE